MSRELLPLINSLSQEIQIQRGNFQVLGLELVAVCVGEVFAIRLRNDRSWHYAQTRYQIEKEMRGPAVGDPIMVLMGCPVYEHNGPAMEVFWSSKPEKKELD